MVKIIYLLYLCIKYWILNNKEGNKGKKSQKVLKLFRDQIRELNKILK